MTRRRSRARVDDGDGELALAASRADAAHPRRVPEPRLERALGRSPAPPPRAPRVAREHELAEPAAEVGPVHPLARRGEEHLLDQLADLRLAIDEPRAPAVVRRAGEGDVPLGGRRHHPASGVSTTIRQQALRSCSAMRPRPRSSPESAARRSTFTRAAGADHCIRCTAAASGRCDRWNSSRDRDVSATSRPAARSRARALRGMTWRAPTCGHVKGRRRGGAGPASALGHHQRAALIDTVGPVSVMIAPLPFEIVIPTSLMAIIAPVERLQQDPAGRARHVARSSACSGPASASTISAATGGAARASAGTSAARPVPAAAPDRPVGVALLELDPHAGADLRDGPRARLLAREREAGQRPARGGDPGHVGHRRPAAALSASGRCC